MIDHLDSFFTTVQPDYDFELGRFLLLRNSINRISGSDSIGSLNIDSQFDTQLHDGTPKRHK